MFQQRASWDQYYQNKENEKRVLSHKDVTLRELLGKGNFDDVFKGTSKDKIAVAVETCKEDLSQELKLKFLQAKNPQAM